MSHPLLLLDSIFVRVWPKWRTLILPFKGLNKLYQRTPANRPPSLLPKARHRRVAVLKFVLTFQLFKCIYVGFFPINWSNDLLGEINESYYSWYSAFFSPYIFYFVILHFLAFTFWYYIVPLWYLVCVGIFIFTISQHNKGSGRNILYLLPTRSFTHFLLCYASFFSFYVLALYCSGTGIPVGSFWFLISGIYQLRWEWMQVVFSHHSLKV